MHCLETIAIRNAEHSGRLSGIRPGTARAEQIIAAFVKDTRADQRATVAFVAAHNLLAQAPGKEAR